MVDGTESIVKAINEAATSINKSLDQLSINMTGSSCSLLTNVHGKIATDDDILPSKNAFKTSTTNKLDQGSDAGRLMAIQLAINQGITIVNQRISATGNSINLSAQSNARGITTNASANATGINSTISAAASMIVEAINNIDGGGGSGGGYGSTVDYGTSSGGTGGVAGFVGGYWEGVPGYASGGYVDRPTLAMIGEGTGGEYVVPENDMQQILSMSALSNLSVSASIDVTGMQSQLQAAIDSVSVSPLVIPVAFDSEGMRETLTSMLYEILQEVRV
jgi:hypothetical protein